MVCVGTLSWQYINLCVCVVIHVNGGNLKVVEIHVMEYVKSRPPVVQQSEISRMNIIDIPGFGVTVSCVRTWYLTCELLLVLASVLTPSTVFTGVKPSSALEYSSYGKQYE